MASSWFASGATMLRTFPSNRSGPTTSTFVPVVRAMLMSLTADGRALESALRRDLEEYGADSGLTPEQSHAWDCNDTPPMELNRT